LHGARFLSMSWIIYGHTYYYVSLLILKYSTLDFLDLYQLHHG
jgi:hypothetical protein